MAIREFYRGDAGVARPRRPGQRPLHDRGDAVRRHRWSTTPTAPRIVDRRARHVEGVSASTPVQMGYIFSAFGWSYVICQIPGGWLLDRFGSKIVYFASIFIWSLFTLLQGGVGVLGAARGRARPCSSCASGRARPKRRRSRPTAASWRPGFPANERGTASAIFNSAQYFATVLFAPDHGLARASFRLAATCSTSWASSASSSASSGSR